MVYRISLRSLFSFFLLFLFVSFGVKAQYHITFKYEYYSADGDAVIPIEVQNSNYQDYYVIDGMSKSIFDCGENWITVEDSIKNQRIEITPDGQMTIKDGSERSFKAEKIEHLDTLVSILGFDCTGIKVTYAEFTITSFYSDQIKVKASSFDFMKYGDYNKIIKEMGGALALKFIYDFGNGKVVANPILFEKVDLSPDDFKPKLVLEKFQEKNRLAFDEIQSAIEDKYNIGKGLKSIEVSGTAMQGKLSFPVSIKLENPNLMLLTMTFNGTNFYVGKNTRESWQYNPFNETVNVEEVEKTKNFREDYLCEFDPLLKSNWDQYNILSFKDLDSAYRVVVKRKSGPEMEVYYYDKPSLLVTKRGDGGSHYEYGDYKIFNGLPFPIRYSQHKYEGDTQGFNALFTEVKFEVDFPDNVFEIPIELKSKVVKKEQSKTYEDYYNEAEVLSNDKKYEEAVKRYKQAITLNGNLPLYHNQLGLAMLNIGDRYGAIAEFSKALDLSPEYHTARSNLGYTKMNLGDYKAAIIDINKAIALNDQNPTYFSNRGLCYYHLEKYDSALINFKMVVSLEETRQFGYWNMAMSYYNLKQYDSAIVFYNKAVDNNYETSELHNYRGICHYQLENYKIALSDFTKATEAKEPLLNYYINLGRTYSHLKNSQKAIQAFEKGIKLDSTYCEGHNLIGLEYFNEGSYDAAIVSFTRAIAINNTVAIYFDNRANAKSNKMDYVGAIEDLSQSINLYPDDANVYYQRGLAKRNINENFDACRDFKKAADMGSEEAQESIDEFCVYGN